MAMQVGPTGQVASFEPDTSAFNRLKYHVRINDLQNVKLFEAAASNICASSNLIVTHGLGSSFSHFQYEDEQVSEQTPTLKVDTVVADELVLRGLIRPPDLIKVDVQGHGAKALQGSINSITSKSPVIIFSNHSQWELEGTRKLLEPLGYEARKLTGDSMRWKDLNLGTGILVRLDRKVL